MPLIITIIIDDCLTILNFLSFGHLALFFLSGTPVLAKWKDNHFYPGEVVSCEKRAKCSVLFDDGNQLTVKTDHVIPVSLVPVGQSVLADCGSGWNELVTVVSHWAEDTERGYVVRKASERR